MPLYRFNLVNGSHALFDEQGLEFPNKEELTAQSWAALRELWQEEGPQYSWAGWSLEIVDQSSGSTVLTIALESRPIPPT
jgi:hypothetical protein